MHKCTNIYFLHLRYSLIHGEDKSVTITSAKIDCKLNEHTNENNISTQSDGNQTY